ncbi:MAG: aldehyde ferredoxin oxidoreductase [Desulfohalobiaceae bacterium]|nr:aldehyde ferredoxin oxidoreductase [Desulfohalobiaceae bacterium]
MEYLLRVDVASKRVVYEPVPEVYQPLGGRILTARILLDEVKPTCEPLGKHNKLIFATGLLAGTPVSSSGRLSIGAKSPLTKGIKESNSGGTLAARLAQMSIKALIIEGLPENNSLSILVVEPQGSKLIPSDTYKEMGVYAFADSMQERFPDASVACIGPAGERLYNAAGVAITDKDGCPSRYCGRGGLGAVMGAKGLKGIVIPQKGKSRVINEEDFKVATKRFSQTLKDAPSTKAYKELGTAAMLERVNSLCGLPTRNFSQGVFEKADDINARALVDKILERGGEGKQSHACMPGCLIQCSNVYVDENGKTMVAPLEYESIVLLGSNLGIGDLDDIARLNWHCNDIGVDTIEMGAALGVAMEANLASFGDAKAALDLLEKVREGTPLGRVLGNGSGITGEVFGVINVPVVKNQGMPGYDPRAIKGMGVTYLTTAMGADHTAGPTARAEVDHASAKDQADLSLKMQKLIAMFDCTGLCLFCIGAVAPHPDLVLELINARFGWDKDLEWLNNMYQEMMQIEYEFNSRAGFTKFDNRFNEAFTERELPELSTVFDVPDDEIDRICDSIKHG